MSVLWFHDPDKALRDSERTQAALRKQQADQVVSKFVGVTESLRQHNETNHFAERLQIAFGGSDGGRHA